MKNAPKYNSGSTNFIPLNSKTPYRKVHLHSGSREGLNCCECGWPFKVTSSVLLAGRTEEGEKSYKHARCPSLAERKVLRAEALANA